jgi:hypothetical protein
MNGIGVVMNLSKSPDLKIVEPIAGAECPPGQPHHTRLSQSLSTEGVNTGVFTMDGDRMRMTFRGYMVLVIMAIAICVCTYGGYAIGGYLGFEAGVAKGKDLKEREFILDSIKQENNIRKAQELFPEQAPPKEKK